MESVPTNSHSSPEKSELLIAPSLGSVEELLLETQKEMGMKLPDKIELDIKSINEVWESHKESIRSPSTKATLEKVKISIVDESIKVIVPSSVSKEEIGQELQLYQKLREKFNNSDLNIIIDVDRSQFSNLEENQHPKMYTMKEKYAYLSDKNPELDNLVKKLKLKIDQE